MAMTPEERFRVLEKKVKFLEVLVQSLVPVKKADKEAKQPAAIEPAPVVQEPAPTAPTKKTAL